MIEQNAEKVRLYEDDLTQVVGTMAAIGDIFKGVGDVYARTISVDLWSMNNYPIGELCFEEDQGWSFLPHIDGEADG